MKLEIVFCQNLAKDWRLLMNSEIGFRQSYQLFGIDNNNVYLTYCPPLPPSSFKLLIVPHYASIQRDRGCDHTLNILVYGFTSAIWGRDRGGEEATLI